MAGTDNESNKNADQKSSKRSRRVISSPTVRERNEKQQISDAKPSRKGKLRRIVVWPFVKLGHGFRYLNRFKPLRIIGYVVAPVYFRGAVREVRLVTWPDRKQSRQLTGAVIIFALIFGILVALVDYGLDKVFKKVILKQ